MAKELTDSQQSELIEQYVELITDSMDYKSLEQFVYDTLKDDFIALSNSELQDEIKYSFDEEILEELVDNVTQQYPKQDVKQSLNQMETFIPGFHD